MNKKDLKTGMTVKLRKGDVCLVINDFIADKDSFMYFADFDDNLICIGGFPNHDIIEVYQFTNPVTKLNVNTLTNLLDLNKTGMNLLWKRKELPKLSSAERVILENLDKRYKLIARDKSEKLFAYYRIPNKDTTFWRPADIQLTELVFPNLFKFVKWEDEQPYNIEELLKGETR